MFRFLQYLHWTADGASVYVISKCRAEMRKSTTYNVHICLLHSGVVDSTECDCAAGVGPNAHCKHVRTALHALVQFSSYNSLSVELTCTQSLQTFHHPKRRHTGSPVKAQNLQLKPHTTLIFDPTPHDLRETDMQLNYRVRNETINYAALSNCSIPLLQTAHAANMYAINNDHDYLTLSPAEQFLASQKISALSPISAADISDIQQRTHGQSDVKDWTFERAKRLQSSNFGRIAKATDRTDLDKLADSYMQPTAPVSCKAIRHGKQYESIALEQYSKLKDTAVQKSGIIVDSNRPYLGCSPDGLVGFDRVVEVKCPYTGRHGMISPETVPYLQLDERTGLLTLNPHITTCFKYRVCCILQTAPCVTLLSTLSVITVTWELMASLVVTKRDNT